MIRLKPLSETDVISFYQWINDEEVIKYSLSLFQKLNTNHAIDNWFQEVLNDDKDISLGIYLEKNNQLVGYAGISNISKTNKSGEFFIFIGDKNSWGKGIGTLTTKAIVEMGFNQHQLNRIMLTVSEPNIGGVKAYQKAGFKIEGRLRQACFRDGSFHDKIIMSILKEEFSTSVD